MVRKNKHTKIVWVCNLCNSVVVSDSKQHHCMNSCNCGAYAIDLEEYMMRISGNNPKEDIKILAKYDYNTNKWTRKRKIGILNG